VRISFRITEFSQGLELIWADIPNQVASWRTVSAQIAECVLSKFADGDFCRRTSGQANYRQFSWLRRLTVFSASIV
jgi:hypothetical protein